MFGNVHTKRVVLHTLTFEIIADFWGLFFVLLWI